MSREIQLLSRRYQRLKAGLLPEDGNSHSSAANFTHDVLLSEEPVQDLTVAVIADAISLSLSL